MSLHKSHISEKLVPEIWAKIRMQDFKSTTSQEQNDDFCMLMQINEN